MYRTACLWLLFSSDLLWPDIDLDLFRYDLCAHAVSFSNIYQLFVEFELFAAHLSDSTAQNAKTVFLIFDLTLTMHVIFILKR